MRWISTTIKRKYMDAILDGFKSIEYKQASDYWTKRLQKYVGRHYNDDLGINFLCGQKSYKYNVREIKYHESKIKRIDGEWVEGYYEIYIDHRLIDLEEEK